MKVSEQSIAARFEHGMRRGAFAFSTLRIAAACYRLIAFWLLLLAASGARSDPALPLADLAGSDLSGGAFLNLVEEEAGDSLCAIPALRECFAFSSERCRRELRRGSDQCVARIRRLIDVTGVSDQSLNPSFVADYAACVLDRAAMVRLLEPSATRRCVVDGSEELARLLPEFGK